MIAVLVVGYGHMGVLHARTVLNAAGRERVALLGVVDVDPVACSRATAAGIRAWSSLDEALADVTPTAAIVATSPSGVAWVTEILLTRGIHVLAEKPLAESSTEAIRLAQTADERRLILAVGFTERFSGPAVALLVELAALDPHPSRSIRICRSGPPPPFSHSSSPAIDLGVHDLDHLLNSGVIVSNIDFTTNDQHAVLHATASRRGEKIATVVMDASWGARVRREWFIESADRRRQFSLLPPNPVRRRDPLSRQLGAFIAEIRRSPRPDLAHALDAAAALAIIEVVSSPVL